MTLFEVLTSQSEITQRRHGKSELETRANVKFLTKLKWEKMQILDVLQGVYGGTAPLRVIVNDGIRRFKKKGEP